LKPPVKKLAEHTFLRHGGSDHLLKAVYRDRPNDIALFELPKGVRPPSFPYALGNSDDLRVGNYIYVVGNPMNLGVNVREGIVSALRAPQEISHVDAKGENAFMVSNGLVPGDSGTPVIAIRDDRFELVGLSQGTFVGNNRLGWVIRINAIRYLLDGAHAVPKEMWTKAPPPAPVRVIAKKASLLPPPFWGAVRVSP
jgi:serine protease Do